MMIENKEILPLGSVVKLKKIEREIMIVGLYPISISQDGIPFIYGYIGVNLPVGIMGEESVCFNSADIENILFWGYASDVTSDFIDEMKKWFFKYESTFKVTSTNLGEEATSVKNEILDD